MQALSTIEALGEHVVQFYEDADYLCEVVADFLAAGMATGEPALLVATGDRATGIVRGLRTRGVDIERARATNRLTLCDPLESVQAVLDAGRVDPDGMNAWMTGMAHRLLGATGGSRIYAYGENSDLLCRQGGFAAALEGEAIWNAHPQRNVFRLLCSYPLEVFSSVDHHDWFSEVCRQHDCVIPTERYVRETELGRLLRISELEQREKALESELRHRLALEEQLRQALQERDELLERERLARLEAEAANRAKADFLAVMNHELRTPLNAIAGYTELLEVGVAGPIRDEQRDMLVRIQRSQKHLLSLIDGVLTFTHGDVSSSAVVEDAKVTDLVHSAESYMRSKMLAHSLSFETGRCQDSLVVRGDPSRIRQILVNLLSNASKYTPSGGAVRVTCSGDVDNVKVHVRDTGIGIAPQHLEAIFEPFFQVDTRLTRVDEGLGLGLAIARRFALAMGGNVTVASRKGQGSTFTLTLPRGGASTAPPPVATAH